MPPYHSFDKDYGPFRDELAKISCVMICKSDEIFDKWMEQETVRTLQESMAQIIRLPNPCFPKVAQQRGGRVVVADQALLDVFEGKAREYMQYKPASCGAIQSHRNAYWWGETNCPNEWMMIIEDDINPRENATEKILVALAAAKKFPETQMIMLAGSDAPNMISSFQQNSTVIHGAMKWLELRTYPAHNAGTNIVPLHVGMGLKWYMVSPLGRQALLKMRVPFRSFERCVWRTIFDTFQYTEKKKWYDPKYMTSVIAADPVLAVSEVQVEEDFDGSGVKRSDAGHSDKPYILIAPWEHWTIFQRLNTLAACIMFAKVLSVRIVMVWEKTATVPIAFEELAGVSLAAKKDGIHIQVLADYHDSSYSHYNTHGDMRLKVEQPLLSIPMWQWLQYNIGKNEKLSGKVQLDDNPGRYLEIKQTWLETMWTDLPGSGLEEHLEWPDDLFLLMLPDGTDLETFAEGQGTVGMRRWFDDENKKTQFLERAARKVVDLLDAILNKNPYARIIPLYLEAKTPPELWNQIVWHLRKKASKAIVLPKWLQGTFTARNRKYDPRKPDYAMEEKGRCLAKVVGLLQKVPPNRLIYPIMQWTVMLNHVLEHENYALDIIWRTYYQDQDNNNQKVKRNGPACQSAELIADTGILRALTNDMSTKNRKGYANMTYMRWIVENVEKRIEEKRASPSRVAEGILPHNVCVILSQIPDGACSHAEYNVRCFLESRWSARQAAYENEIMTVLQELKPVMRAHRMYTDIAVQSHVPWSFEKALLMVVVNSVRDNKHFDPLYIDDATKTVGVVTDFTGDFQRLMEAGPPSGRVPVQASTRDDSDSESAQTRSRSPATPRPSPSKRVRLLPNTKTEPTD